MKSLNKLYSTHNGKISIKWKSYIDKYDNLLKPFINRESLSIFEIGILHGGSLEIWAKFFTNATKIIGCDINKSCKDLSFKDPRIEVIIGDVNSNKIKNKILSNNKHFDLIIDDGSHNSKDIIKSFLLYFPYLNNDGVYIIEDLHASYWQNHDGGLFHPYSSISFLKKLVDIQNFNYWKINKKRKDFIKGILKNYNIHTIEKNLLNIQSIEFADSLCIIKKGKNINDNKFNKILVAGDIDNNKAKKLSQTFERVNDKGFMSQKKNIWSMINTSPEEEFFEMKPLFESYKNELELIKNSLSWKITKPLRSIKIILMKIFFKNKND